MIEKFDPDLGPWTGSGHFIPARALYLQCKRLGRGGLNRGIDPLHPESNETRGTKVRGFEKERRMIVGCVRLNTSPGPLTSGTDGRLLGCRWEISSL